MTFRPSDLHQITIFNSKDEALNWLQRKGKIRLINYSSLLNKLKNTHDSMQKLKIGDWLVNTRDLNTIGTTKTVYFAHSYQDSSKLVLFVYKVIYSHNDGNVKLQLTNDIAYAYYLSDKQFPNGYVTEEGTIDDYNRFMKNLTIIHSKQDVINLLQKSFER